MHEQPSKNENSTQLKISPRLFEEINRIKDFDRVVPVTIKCIEEPIPPEDTSLEQSLEYLQKETGILQQVVIEELEKLGVDPKTIEKYIFANSISTSLTADNLFRIAELDQVKMIEFNGPDLLVAKT
jgi:hypothetical protein